MPRISPLENPGDEIRAMLEKTLPGPNGKPLNIFRTLARWPELMKPINSLGGYFMRFGQLEVRDREIVILRAASRVGSDYEIGQHRWIGAKAGLSENEIDAVLNPDSECAWTEQERLLLEVTDELFETETLSDATWTRLSVTFSETVAVELVVMVGFYRMLGGFLNALEVELDLPVIAVLESSTG